MNLITCNKDCIHQKDGYCKLNSISSITEFGKSECCYYSPNKDGKIYKNKDEINTIFVKNI